ncbi:hypothetical protein JXA80_12485, partial [bacterium]|nr:hypothetical protein [candidate division CSSED10-310 bacterium]
MAPFISAIPAVVLGAVFAFSANGIAGDPFWAHFLIWRLPLLLVLPGCILHFSLRDLPHAARNRLVTRNHWTAIIAIPALFVHFIGPSSHHPQPLFALIYLGTFAIQAGWMGTVLLSVQRRHPLSSPIIFLAGLWFFSAHAAWQAPIHSVSGDEPHYLMMAHSIVHDGDLNLFNQYRDGAYHPYHPGVLEPKPSDDQNRGIIFSRGLGATFPVLLAPAYAVAGHTGAQFFMILCAALLTMQLYRLVLIHAPTPVSALAATGLTVSTIPTLTYSSLIYPDIPAALLIVTALRLLLIKPVSKAGRSVPSWLVIISAVLIFMKFRYFVPVLLLLIPLVLRLRRNMVRTVLFFITVLTCAGGYLLADRLIFAGDLFANRFGGLAQLTGYLPDWSRLWIIPGILFDQESGFLFFAPIYFLCLPGALMYRKQKNAVFWFSLLGVPLTIVSLLGHFAWHSLPTPPLRYLLPVLPPCAVFIASALDRWRDRSFAYRSLAMMCIFWSWLVVFFASANPEFMVNLADGSSRMLEWFALVLKQPVPVYFPSLIRPGTALLAWSFPLLVSGLVLACRRWREGRRRAAVFNPLSGLVTVLVMVLVMNQLTSQFNVNKYHPEDQWWATARNGAYFPINRDPFFHQETAYGWQLAPGGWMRMPVNVDPGMYTMIIRCRVADSCAGQKVQIRFGDHRAGMIPVSSFDWMDCAIRLPDV